MAICTCKNNPQQNWKTYANILQNYMQFLSDNAKPIKASDNTQKHSNIKKNINMEQCSFDLIQMYGA